MMHIVQSCGVTTKLQVSNYILACTSMTWCPSTNTCTLRHQTSVSHVWLQAEHPSLTPSPPDAMPGTAIGDVHEFIYQQVAEVTYHQDAERLCFLQPRAQPRPVIPTPSQGRLVMPGQAQLPRARSMQAANGYAPAVQPRHAEEAYVVAAVPARQAYTETVRCYPFCFLTLCMYACKCASIHSYVAYA